VAQRVHTLVEAMRRLARRGAVSSLKRTVEKSRPEDIAAAIGHLAPHEQKLVISQVDDDITAANVLVQLDDADFKLLAADFEFGRLVRLLNIMEVDDEADIIQLLPDEIRERVLEAIHHTDKEHVEEILTYAEDSAGGIMQPLVFVTHEDTTCRDAINHLHEAAGNLEMIFYLYVENVVGQLVGVTSLRALLTHPPSTILNDFMITEVITVSPETDQEEVARFVSRYDLLAVPVVDEGRRLLGIVTIDDVVDVIQDEALEDMLLMAGVADDVDPTGGSVFKAARQRAAWLFITLLGGIAMAEVIGVFEEPMKQLPVLAGFIPVMMGMGGNVGVQAATIAVQKIATGHAKVTGLLKMAWHEMRVGLIMGSAFALILGGYSWLTGDYLLAIAVSTSIVATVTVATSFGMMVPYTFHRFGVDPAIATGPLVTTGIDVVAILIYFGTCMSILDL
jgi:magnesium transporter